jgi:hypothetical protein
MTINAHDLVVAIAGSDGTSGCNTTSAGSGQMTALSDSSSDTGVALGNSSQDFVCLSVWYIVNATASTTVTLTFGNTVGALEAVVVMNCSGVKQTSPLDGSFVSGQTTSGTTITTSSLTTSVSGDLVIAASANYYTAGTWSAGSAGGQAMAIPTNGSTNATPDGHNAAGEWVALTGTISGTVSIGNSSAYGNIIAVAFLPGP